MRDRLTRRVDAEDAARVRGRLRSLTYRRGRTQLHCLLGRVASRPKARCATRAIACQRVATSSEIVRPADDQPVARRQPGDRRDAGRARRPVRRSTSRSARRRATTRTGRLAEQRTRGRRSGDAATRRRPRSPSRRTRRRARRRTRRARRQRAVGDEPAHQRGDSAGAARGRRRRATRRVRRGRAPIATRRASTSFGPSSSTMRSPSRSRRRAADGRARRSGRARRRPASGRCRRRATRCRS